MNPITNNEDLAKELRKFGYNIEYEKGYTPLLCACIDYPEHTDLKIIKFIVENTNVDINAQCDYDGNSAVMLVYDFEVQKYLIDKGICVNLQDNCGQTILMNACFYSDLKLIKYLIKNTNINPHLKDIAGNTALTYAKKGRKSKKMIELINSLIKKYEHNICCFCCGKKVETTKNFKCTMKEKDNIYCEECALDNEYTTVREKLDIVCDLKCPNCYKIDKCKSIGYDEDHDSDCELCFDYVISNRKIN